MQLVKLVQVSPLIALMKEQVEKFNERAKQQGRGVSTIHADQNAFGKKPPAGSKMKACFLGSGAGLSGFGRFQLGWMWFDIYN